MKFSQIAPIAALVASASAYGYGNNTAITSVTYVTTDYVTYCPEPTTFIHKNVTYTATEPTTITITNCPCTVTCVTPAPHPTTEGTAIVTVHPPPVTVVENCTPVGPDGKPTPTHKPEHPAPSHPAPEHPEYPVPEHPAPSHPAPEHPEEPAVSPPAETSPPVVVDAATRVGAGVGAIVLAAVVAVFL